MERKYEESIFWVDVEKISPNPFQPRREFDDLKLASLADSMRQYGVLQPLVVTRHEEAREDGGLSVKYELIAGERRLRASKIAGLAQVPVVIRAAEESDKMKLELAIIENLQREDLNPIDRAKAFNQLAEEHNLKHIEIAKKVGKSREYVSNTLRLLMLPEDIQHALATQVISEGHARPLMMLADRPEERLTLFKEITNKKLTVRESERIARRIAVDRARKQDLPVELLSLEKELTDSLGTRVQIEPREKGGKIHIDFFSSEDLRHLLEIISTNESQAAQAATAVSAATHGEATTALGNSFATDEPLPEIDTMETQAEEISVNRDLNDGSTEASTDQISVSPDEHKEELVPLVVPNTTPAVSAVDTSPLTVEEAIKKDEHESTSSVPTPPVQEKKEEPEDLYSLKNFSL